MNGLLIAVLVILAAAILHGYWRGFIRMVVSLVSLIVILILVSWATPHVTDFLKENTQLYTDLTETCTEKIRALAEGGEDDTQAETDSSWENQPGKEDLEGLELPQVWLDHIMESGEDLVDEAVENTGIYNRAGAYVANWILQGLVFLVVFLVSSMALRLVVGLLDLVSKLPLIHGANRLLGGVVGFLQGLLIIWLLFFVLALACTSETGRVLLGYVGESRLLTWLYQKNVLLYLLQGLLG